MTVSAGAVGARERSRFETRRRLLEAGTEIFARQGEAKTRITDIASAADVAPGTMYCHFKDKGDLLREILAQAVADLHGRLRNLVERSDVPIADSVREHTEVLVCFAEEHPMLCRLLFSTEVATMDIGADFLAAFAHMQEDRLREGMAEGYFRPDLDPTVAAHALVGMLTHVLYWWTEDPTRASREAVIDTITNLRLAGVHGTRAGKEHVS